ncbi:hypothetical protein [Serratia symbiotica]|uniref:Uncharacterized protein n=1 Tax=Serratia symbiotica SCt-VLC TaxID=1347341 RepID=A0A068RD80_9GAMM|nr:hypothetical protein [Serratia symbiotica]CDG48709.1 hypothetical protein SCTVLC_2036 [Serratia symbiotica SCt-VLC]
MQQGLPSRQRYYSQEYVSALLAELKGKYRRIAELERITEGVDQLAIDGGWTARGMSEYAKSLEARLATPVPLPERYSVDCGVCADPNGEWLSYSDVVAALCEHKLLELSKPVADDYKQAARECVDDLTEKPGKHHDR